MVLDALPDPPSPSPEERKDLRLRGFVWPRRGRRVQRANLRRKAREIEALQLREAVMRWTHEKVSDTEIAARLGYKTTTQVKQIRKDAIGRSIQREIYRREVEAMNDAQDRAQTPASSRARSRALVPTNSRRLPPPPPDGDPIEGEIFDSPEIIQLRKDCLQLRKAMLPFDRIALVLGVSENEARTRTQEALREIEQSEQGNADTERRLMIEQIDQMIAAIHPMSTGLDLQFGTRPVVLEAIDRMLKLMQRKADLLGLSAPPAVDIRIRLQQLADEGGYDIVDLEDIARDVLQSHKLKLPEFR